ncbi:isopentenyl-diphosphate delta-isomerase idi1 [Bulinus truncatus]|nr:isopentenyl-diphosphate delta-isomerase idi1 [Bulinus truncatus]
MPCHCGSHTHFLNHRSHGNIYLADGSVEYPNQACPPCVVAAKSRIPLEDFHYLTRILYKAENVPKDNKWGEHEIDYILFIQRDVEVIPNPNEVKSYRYVSQQDLSEIVEKGDNKELLLTPWFKLIVKNFLQTWWNSLHNIESQADRNTIHRML